MLSYFILYLLTHKYT